MSACIFIVLCHESQTTHGKEREERSAVSCY